MHWNAISSATSRPCRLASGNKFLEIVQRAQLCDGSKCGRLLPSRSPRGCPHHPAAPRRNCSFLSGRCARWDGWAADRRRRNPWTQCTEACASQSRNVPCRPGSGEQDLGNTSYHVENRAFSRSTTTANRFSYWVDELHAPGSVERRLSNSGSRAHIVRDCLVLFVSRKLECGVAEQFSILCLWRARPHLRAAALQSAVRHGRPAPHQCASIKSLRHVVKRSIQPSTVYSISPHAPEPETRRATDRCRWATMGEYSRRGIIFPPVQKSGRRPGRGRRRIRSASTTTVSPTTRLIAKSAAIDLRPNALDDHTTPSVTLLVRHAQSPPGHSMQLVAR